jgi:hypothetical protein
VVEKTSAITARLWAVPEYVLHSEVGRVYADPDTRFSSFACFVNCAMYFNGRSAMDSEPILLMRQTL